MDFGVPKEVRDLERRVGLTPGGVHMLVKAGHTVYVERGAGHGAGFSDEAYRGVGAQIVYSAEEAYRRAEVAVKVTRPTAAEHALFRHGQTLFGFLHLPVASPDFLAALRESEITAIAYETIQDEQGELPVLLPTSEVAGRLAPVIAGHLLGDIHEGRGILLSGIPGIPPADVVILGAGVLGANAARAFVGAGAQVTVLDRDLRKLQHLDEALYGRAVTMLATPYNIEKAVEFADVLVGAVHVPGQRAPVLVSRAMLRRMRPRAVILDFSIDSGGCIETSRPTTHRDPTFIAEGIIHYCVPNVPARVARTASYALTNASLPYLLAIGQEGVDAAIRRDSSLARGVLLYQGRLANPRVAAALGQEVEITL